ncbi:TIGR00288 family NYN domain-containing protein [Candidatus Micrarchaeota archaeon]|nr:TIGR00288 family NYN domain-containing protein [Candidatus Micrarchaeota archaeon]
MLRAFLGLIEMLDKFFGLGKPNIAVLVDGPNILRKAFNIDLVEIKKELLRHGNIRIAKIYLDQYASDKLIEAMVNQGFETEITTGDVDVTMAIEAMEYVMDKNIDIIALMTRDTDYRPVLVKAKKYGKKTIIIATDVAFSAALRNTADKLIIFKGKGKIETIVNSE